MEINRECLKKNLRVKSYRELCEVLGLEVKSGNTKISQLKELSRHCEYHREGNGYVIDKVFKEGEVAVKKKRGGANNKKYQKELEEVMLCMLNTSDSKVIECSVVEALQLCCLINMNYQTGRADLDCTSQVLEMDKLYIADFYNNTHSKLKQIFERVLRSMNNRALVNFSKVARVAYCDDKGNKFTAEATTEQIKEILSAERRVLDQMGFYGKQQAFASGYWNQFKDRVNELLYKSHGIMYYYDAYSIVLNKEGIRAEVDKLEMLNSKGKLNSTVVQSLMEGSVRRHKKEKPAWGEDESRVATHSRFVENQNKLIASLIDVNTEVNLSKVKKVK